MIFQGRVAMERISRARAWAISRLRNSVRYFIGESASRHPRPQNRGPGAPSGFSGVGVCVIPGLKIETGGTHGDSGVSGVRRRGLATAVGAWRLRGGSGAAKGFLLGLELLFKDAEFPKLAEGLLGGGFIDFREREADVDDGVVADLDLGNVVEADLLDDAAEVDAADADHAVVRDGLDSAWNGEAHDDTFIPPER